MQQEQEPVGGVVCPYCGGVFVHEGPEGLVPHVIRTHPFTPLYDAVQELLWQRASDAAREIREAVLAKGVSEL